MNNQLLRPEEKEILSYIRGKKYSEIKIRFLEGKINLIELSDHPEISSTIEGILKEANYQDLQLKKDNGKVVSIKRTVKRKLK